MTKKTTKRSLAMSILSLVLCLAMLIGSTYAWFSDEAKTDAVTITAGNLDVDIVKGTAKNIEEAKMPANSLDGQPLFTDSPENWEPGMMVKSEEFKIANLGTLALKYQIKVTAEKVGETEKNLMDAIDFKVAKASDVSSLDGNSTISDRIMAWNSITGVKDLTISSLEPSSLSKEALVVVLFWYPDNSTAIENPDNDYNIRDDYENTKLQASFKVNVFATQYDSESDSFGNKYDENLIQVADNSAKDEYQGFDIMGGKSLVFNESKTEEGPIPVYGNGTIEIEKGVTIQSTTGLGSMNLGFGTLVDCSIVLKGEGTVKKPADNSSFYGVVIFPRTNVTIESGTYEGIYLCSIPESKEGDKLKVLTINGGTIKGIVNIEDKSTDGSTKHIVINNGEAVKDAEFMQNDTQWIKIPDSGYKWSNPENGRVKLVADV